MRLPYVLTTAAVVLGVMAVAAPAQAASVTLCMKTGQPVLAPAADGTCAMGYTVKKTASDADLTAARTRITALETKLAGVTRTGTTLRFSGVNLQLDNGAGS